MILYSDPLSSNGLRVTLLAAFAERRIEFRRVELVKGENRQPEYLALNPTGQVPTLVDGEAVILESHAILHYLAERWNLQQLWPQDLLRRAEILRWQFWTASTLSPALRPFYWERLFKVKLSLGQPDEALLEGAQPSLSSALALINTALNGRRHLVGEDWTLADLAVAPTFLYAEPAGLALSSYPALEEWRRRISDLPAWKAAQGGSAV